MKIPPAPHAWSVTPGEAVAIQADMAVRVRIEKPPAPVRYVAGVDMAIGREGETCVAGVVLWDLREKRAVEEHTARRALTFPYVPGLLSFREAPAVLAALEKLERTPDVVMCDGQGLAHPRRFGIACHVGVLIDRPTLGCAKSLLVGDYREPGARRGCRAALTHGGERVGTILRTRDRVKPVYVSVGHKLDLPAAERIVLRCAEGYRIPQPTRLADQLVAREKKAD